MLISWIQRKKFNKKLGEAIKNGEIASLKNTQTWPADEMTQEEKSCPDFNACPAVTKLIKDYSRADFFYHRMSCKAMKLEMAVMVELVIILILTGVLLYIYLGSAPVT